jgi:hypothetical protein
VVPLPVRPAHVEVDPVLGGLGVGVLWGLGVFVWGCVCC